MTDLLFHTDPYSKGIDATVTAIHPDGSIELDRTIFFAAGGGQPGDMGTLTHAGGEIAITDTRKGDSLDNIFHQAAEGSTLPEVGASVTLALDWERRYRHMRMHTLLHLLCASVVGDVTGGSIGLENPGWISTCPTAHPIRLSLRTS